MQEYERNLFIVLCLGHELHGEETADEVANIPDVLNFAAEQQPVLPAQEELAEWLNLSLAHCQNRQAASVKLWDRINGRGYGLADVPMKLRRRSFGGSLDIQRRMGKRPWHVRFLRSLAGIVKTLITLTVVGGAIWVAWKAFSG